MLCCFIFISDLIFFLGKRIYYNTQNDLIVLALILNNVLLHLIPY
jgi:hypothetical protein